MVNLLSIPVISLLVINQLIKKSFLNVNIVFFFISEDMLNRLDNLSTTWFPENTKPFVYMDVIDLGGEPITVDEYTPFGRYDDINA